MLFGGRVDLGVGVIGRSVFYFIGRVWKPDGSGGAVDLGIVGRNDMGFAKKPACLDAEINRFALRIGPKAGEFSDFLAVLVDDFMVDELLKVSLCCSAHNDVSKYCSVVNWPTEEPSMRPPQDHVGCDSSYP